MRRRLDAELVRRGLASSRARATELIRGGHVLVGGGPATAPARQVGPQESLRVLAPPPAFVSRGGEKLAAAFDRFALDPTGVRALDAGASTGGFTDCLLQRGATEVVAVDVGRGQLAWKLRRDPRVRVLEGTNARALTPVAIGGAVELAVADLAFISLRTVAPALARCTTADARLVLLVKPQFEAGRSAVGKGGVVRDPLVRGAALVDVVDGLAAHGIYVFDAMCSPLAGPSGNVEYMVVADKHSDPIPSARLRALASDGV